MAEAITWIEALRDNGALWADFKDDLERRILSELQKMLTLRGEDLLVQKGAALALRRFLDDVVKVEREAHAATVWQERARSAAKRVSAAAGSRFTG